MHFPLSSKYAERFNTDNLEPNDPRIEEAVAKYRKDYDLPATAQPLAQHWYGIFDQGELLLVAGHRTVGNMIEVTDMYPLPSGGRRAIIAIYAMMNVYKTCLARGLYSGLQCLCLYRNTKIQRAIERVFECKPSFVGYIAEAKTA